MDITNDSTFNNLLQISNKLNGDLPTYVRGYTPVTEKVASSFEDSEFADSRNRWFPVTDKPSVWTSAAYFSYNSDILPYKQAEFSYVENKIKQAAQIFGISEDVEKAMTIISTNESTEKKAEEIFGLCMEVDGNSVSEFPMYDAEGVKKASEHFKIYRYKYPADWRNSIAHNIMSKAAEYDVSEEELDPSVLKEAGYGIPDKQKLMDEVLYRARMAKNAENAVGLANLNFILADLPIDTLQKSFSKIAMTIADFDVAEGLDSQYGKKVMPPSDVVFGTSIKEAEAVVNDALTLDKHTFSATKLAEAIEPNLLNNLFGDNFSDNLVKDNKLVPEKMAKALKGLPEEDKASLEEYLVNSFEN